MKIEDFLLETGRVNSAKIRETNFKKRFSEAYIDIQEYASRIGIQDRGFQEKFFHWIKREEDPILCKNCKAVVPRFFGIVNGYSEYCSSKCSNGSEEVMERKKKSYFEKYGVDNPSKNSSVLEKIQKTFNSKYGGNPFSLPKYQEVIKKTCIKKYGVNHPLGKGSKLRLKKDEENKKNFLEKYKDYRITYFNPEKWGECRIICNTCGNEFEISKWNLHQRWQAKTNPCTFCNPIGSDNQTFLESFVTEFLETNSIEYERKNRKILDDGREIDFYLPDLKIGIETNGIYWHSDKFKSKNYHKSKTDICLKKGIDLIHIWEDEIMISPEKVRSRLNSILDSNVEKIYARKCDIMEVSTENTNQFLSRFHLQGKTGSSVRIGLYYNGELVSLMTFGMTRKSLGSKSKKGEWELIRFCSKSGIKIIGGAKRLLHYFIFKYSPSKVISFCDRRWSPRGEFYSKIGFKFIYNTEPNYWYYKKNSYERKHRFSFRKDRLVNLGYDEKKTEFQIMDDIGYIRVYDCGSSKWEIELQK